MKKEVRLARTLILLALGVMAAFFVGCGGSSGGAHPPSLEAFDTACLPMDISGTSHGFSSFALDSDRNLLIANPQTSEIHRLDRKSGVLETVATVPYTGYLLALAYDPSRSIIFAGANSGNVYSVDPVTGTSTLLGSLVGEICAMTVAPAGFGSYEGHLIVSCNTGAVFAADPAAGFATSLITTLGNWPSSMVFGPDGTLYVVNAGGGQVLTLSAAGVSSVLASGLSNPDGIAFDGVENRLLVADPGTDTLYAVSVADGTATPLRHVDFDGGWYPTGLAFDGVDTLLMGTGDDYLAITAVKFPGFDASSLPLDVPGNTVSYGDIALDGDGNLLIPGVETGELLSLNRTTGAFRTVADIAPVAGNLLSVVYDPARDTIFVGSTNGDIFGVDPASGASTLLGNVGAIPNGMAIAPSGYGSFGGRIVIATASGTILAANPDAAMATSVVATISGYLSDLVFTPAGTLYVVGGDEELLVTVTATGTVTTFATGFSDPDGIALDKGGNTLLVADSGSGTLYRVNIPDKVMTNMGAFSFNSGYYASGLAFDGYRTVLMVTGSGTSAMTIAALQL